MNNLIIKNYKGIESLTLEKVKESARIEGEYKGYKYYIVDTIGNYGVMLFTELNNKIIYIDSQLHYRHLENLNIDNKLLEVFKLKAFAIEEYQALKLKKYNQYFKMRDWLNNHISKAFANCHVFMSEDEMTPEQIETKKLNIRDYVGINYYQTEQDRDLINSLWDSLEDAHDKTFKTDIKYFKSALEFEFANYEVGYTHDTTEALRALGISEKTMNKEQFEVYYKVYRKTLKGL